MAYLISHVEVDGCPGSLTSISETSAVIHDVDRNMADGAPCHLTVFFNLMGQRVPVKLNGEIFQQEQNELKITYPAPTQNWKRIIRSYS